MTTYVCTKCLIEKPENDFYTKPNGYRVKRCCVCLRGSNKEWYRKNPEAAAILQQKRKEFCKKNPKSLLIWWAKSRAKKYKIPFSLKESDIDMPECCPVLGIPLQNNFGGKAATENSPTLDRIIPELGYVKGNVMVISKRANTIKSDGTIEEHEKVIAYMKKHSI